MTHWLRPFRVVAAIALMLTLVCQGTWVLAGTTGTLNGTVTDATTHKPLAGVRVNVASPSQNVTLITEANGHFSFLALSPDTYTVTATLEGYQPYTVSGVTIVADQTRTLNLGESKQLQTIGRVSSRAVTDLVKPGTSADVYSVNAVTQDKGAVLGGGGALNSAWSALAAVPGVYVAPGQGGYVGASASLSIRGGDYDQIGYEVDGVPVNRAFDNYPSGPASSLGQQEVQVYTGAAPATAEAQGLSGFINQVIKTGTTPAQSQLSADIGGPAFYHKLSAETGGANPSHTFSYYVGVGGYNQDWRYVDQYQGLGVSQLYGTAIAPCNPKFTIAFAPSCYTNGLYNGNTGPGSYVLGSINQFAQNGYIADRDSVVNLHFGLPHKNGTRDDLQLLYVNNYINTQEPDSQYELGGTAYLNALGVGTTYANGYQYNGPLGVALPANYQSSLVNYAFPNAITNGATNTADNPAAIPPNVNDSIANNQAIAKLQYTHAIGTNALLKLYGYTYYSNWLNLSPNSLNSNYYGFTNDYELSSHTRGLSGTFTDQLGSNNLLTLQGAYTTASTLRDNNTQFLNSGREFATLVSSSNPLGGYCYNTAGVLTACSSKTTYVTFDQAATGGLPAAAATCGTGACEWLAVENGLRATYNTVTPKFSSVSLTDQWKPTSRLTIDGGLRYDRFEYEGSDTTGTAARTFFYNAYNNDNCVTTAVPVQIVTRSPGGACPAGSTPANFTNPSGNVTEAYNEYQPRIGFTYSLNPTTVLRGNYGRFAQAPNSAYQQYDTLQQNAPATLYGTYGFQAFGFTTPDHTVVPPTSDNLDFSLEKQFGGDLAVKISPFRRVTQNQIQQFFLNQQTNFVSGLNVGHQTSQGVELEIDKGNFQRNGLAGKIAVAYTNSFIKYGALSNGTSIIDPLNAQIKNYNAYTSFCAKNPNSTPCAGGTTASGVDAPCYTTGGAAAPACGAGTIANPYWNAPVQGLLDPNGNYATFDTFPGGIGSSVAGYGSPYTATAILQYKHDRLAVTPSVQFFAGQRYGAPQSTLGIQPDTCTTALGSATGDSRYPYGAVGGSGFDYSSCATLTGGIPDQYTGKFDTIGAFVEPSMLLVHLQVAYDLSPRISLVANLANLVNTCFGGTKTGFTVKGACSYGVLAGGTTGGVGNTYNPGSAIQPYVQSPYLPSWANINPFNVYVSARIKL